MPNPLDLNLSPLDEDMSIIQKLDDEPNDVGGLTAQDLKASFDKAGNLIKSYINDTHIPELNRNIENYVDETIVLIGSGDMSRGIYDKKRMETDIFDYADKVEEHLEEKHSYTTARLPMVGDIKSSLRKIDDPAWLPLDGRPLDLEQSSELLEKAPRALGPVIDFTELKLTNAVSTILCWSPELGICVSAAGGTSYGKSVSFKCSSDGVNWTTSSVLPYTAIEDVKWFPEDRVFLAVGFQSANSTTSNYNPVILRSANGTVWDMVYRGSRTTTYEEKFTGICRSDTSGMYLAVGTRPYTSSSGGTYYNICTSTNTTNWTPSFYSFYDGERGTNNVEAQFSGCLWCRELGSFVAGSFTSISTGAHCGHVHHSADGTNWQSHPLGPGYNLSVAGIAWSPELRLFATCGTNSSNSYYSGRILLSRNGSDWYPTKTDRRFFGADKMYWDENAKLFIFCGSYRQANVTKYCLMTSHDGHTWTEQYSCETNPPPKSMVYIAPWNKYLASRSTANNNSNAIISGEVTSYRLSDMGASPPHYIKAWED